MAIAGSDTLACTLVYAFSWLAQEPHHQAIILKELRDAGIKGVPIASQVQELPYLNAFVLEVLRLNNPVPTGLPRMTGKKGMTVAGRFIPPYTTVVAPRWNIARRMYHSLHVLRNSKLIVEQKTPASPTAPPSSPSAGFLHPTPSPPLLLSPPTTNAPSRPSALGDTPASPKTCRYAKSAPPLRFSYLSSRSLLQRARMGWVWRGI